MNIGLIAHDAKKKLMQNFCYRLSWNTQQTQFVCNGNYRSTDRERNKP